MATTDFSKKCEILGQFYLEYREDTKLKSFIEYNDIGLPLAFLAAENLSIPTDQGQDFINETWKIFLETLEIEDEGYEDLESIFTMLTDKDE
jgi:hypothetical protein